jgi:hypothetical protein
MARYGNIDYILKLDFFDFFELYVQSKKKQLEENLWNMYVTLLPHMDKEFRDWDYFYNAHIGNESEIKEEKNGVYIDQIGLSF